MNFKNWSNKIKNVALITGSSGFIGFHLAKFLLSCDWKIIGIDVMTDYYDLNLKNARQKLLRENSNILPMFYRFLPFVRYIPKDGHDW